MRYLVRLAGPMSKGGASILCAAVEMYDTGMTLETSKPLPVGHVFRVAVLGVRSLSALSFTGRVGEELPARAVPGLRYYRLEFLEMEPSQQKAIQGLDSPAESVK